MRVDQLDGLEGVGNFRREQVPVLEADLSGCPFKVQINPAAFFEPVGAGEPRVGRRGFCCPLRGRDLPWTCLDHLAAAGRSRREPSHRSRREDDPERQEKRENDDEEDHGQSEKLPFVLHRSPSSRAAGGRRRLNLVPPVRILSARPLGLGRAGLPAKESTLAQGRLQRRLKVIPLCWISVGLSGRS